MASVVSDSVRPHRQQPARLRHPWDSPGKNTGVGCHFLLQCMKVKGESEVAQLCPTLRDPTDCSLPGSSIHGIFQARVLEWGAIAFSDKTHHWMLNILGENLMRRRRFIVSQNTSLQNHYSFQMGKLSLDDGEICQTLPYPSNQS